MRKNSMLTMPAGEKNQYEIAMRKELNFLTATIKYIKQ
ncbi:Uncharacterized protein ChrSV_1025 [Chromobacterium vaccinii]|nr:Uncharacterized protein ChrSW_1025 [Chromobacterium vaccinii]QND88483.1 Uncharacterized protein ChrSV_1025 [Chromobacterium vaccinii]